MHRNSNAKQLLRRIVRNRWAYVMMLPVVVYFAMFKYIPIYYMRLSFYDYKILKGFSGSRYVGLQWFQRFFSSPSFWPITKNTILFSIGAIFWQTLAPIVFALFINEVGNKRAKKVYQTISFMPYFISTVIVVTIINSFISPSLGILNAWRRSLGLESVYYLGQPEYFFLINYVSGVWSCMGWNSVIYLSALSGIDTEIYEAALVDGATRIKRIFHITIPSILPTIAILLTMSVGALIAGGNLEKVLLLQNDLNYSASEMLNTYTYKLGLVNGKYSYATAIGFAMSVVSLALVLLANALSKRLSDNIGVF